MSYERKFRAFLCYSEPSFSVKNYLNNFQVFQKNPEPSLKYPENSREVTAIFAYGVIKLKRKFSGDSCKSMSTKKPPPAAALMFQIAE